MYSGVSFCTDTFTVSVTLLQTGAAILTTNIACERLLRMKIEKRFSYWSIVFV